MKVKVLRTFCDKYNLARVFTPGEVVDFEQERAKDIVSRGLAKYFKEEVKPEPKKEEPAKEEQVEQPAIFNEEPKQEVAEAKKRGRKRKTE